MRETVFVTGATGYLGGHCARVLEQAGFRVRRGARRPPPHINGQDWFCYGDLAEKPQFREAVDGCNTVVHFAGPSQSGGSAQEIAHSRRVHVEGTSSLAAACASAGVGRLVFISTALVLAGSRNAAGRIDDLSPPRPLTPYACHKSEAEAALRAQPETSGTSFVILRPPMVYGPGAPGNFRRLMRLVASGLPIPLGLATAPKSFIFIDNLMSAIMLAMTHENACGSAFLIADAEETSTAELIRLMASAMQRPARLLPVPATMLRAFFKVAGRTSEIESLLQPLAIDSKGIASRLGWCPPVTLENGVARTVATWRTPASEHRRR